MKKILLLLAFVAVSCSSEPIPVASDEQNPDTAKNGYNPGGTRIDPTKLAKVIIGPGASNERQWFFYPNGLLWQIRKPDGTIQQTFQYDASNRLIASIGVSGIPYYFTYDNQNRITSMGLQTNTQPVSFDNATNTYILGTDPIYHTEIVVNPDLLITSEKMYYQDIDNPDTPAILEGAYLGRVNGNMVYVSSGGDSYSTHTFDDKINPFKQALLPICRALGLYGFGDLNKKFANPNYNSINNLLSLSYDIGDPESSSYVYEFNTNQLPIKQTEYFYYLGVLEGTRVNILYYYQGDIILNP